MSLKGDRVKPSFASNPNQMATSAECAVNVDSTMNKLKALEIKPVQAISNFTWHEDLLKDEVRTRAFQSAILENRHIFKGKVVLDVGCGSGLFCLFAAKAGAHHVYGVENSNMALAAENNVKGNGFENRITIIQGKMSEVTLPVEKVDVIISDWMGYCLFMDSFVDSVIDARDKYLNEGGIMFPDSIAMYVLGIEDRRYKQDKIDWWISVHGYDMSCMRKQVMLEPSVDGVNPKQICTSNFKFKEFDLYTIKKEDKSFKVPFALKGERRDYLTALVVYFTVRFTKCHTFVGFSTSPRSKWTHWKQTVFYLERPLKIDKGETVNGEFKCIADGDMAPNMAFEITLSFKGKADDTESHVRYFMKSFS